MNTDPSPTEIHRNLLIAVDGSKPSLKAVDYAVHVTRIIHETHFNLVSVLPAIPPILQAEAKTDGAMNLRLKKMEAANRRRAEEILDAARKHLMEHGVDETRILTRVRPRISGLAKDIINEAEMGRFDGLVVGRRGLTRTQEVFMGSVSNQLIQHAANVPLWIIDGDIVDPKLIVAVDGSTASLRAVDHVAFMLGDNPEARVAFLHVSPMFQNYCPINLDEFKSEWEGIEQDVELMEEAFIREDHACSDDFMDRAVQVLKQAGFSQDRISIERRENALGVGRTIVNTARELGYGTIVIGRRGMGKSSFLGSVSDRVIRRAENMAIWLVN